MIRVRAARESDAPHIADFNHRLARESEDRELDRETLARGVAALLADPARGQYWIAESIRAAATHPAAAADPVAAADPASAVPEPVGQCLVTTEWSDWTNGRYWWFQSVYVVSEFRGQGVFRALWDHVETAARREGDVASLRLYVEQANISARAVYEKLGMEATGYLVYEKWLIER